MLSWRCPFLSENQPLLDRFLMVQRSICLDVFLELLRIVLPTGFIASELVCCFDMMDARQFLVMPVTCPKKRSQIGGTRTSQEGFCYLTGISRNLGWLLWALGLFCHFDTRSPSCLPPRWGRLTFEFGWTFPPEQVLLVHQRCWWFLSAVKPLLDFWYFCSMRYDLYHVNGYNKELCNQAEHLLHPASNKPRSSLS